MNINIANMYENIYNNEISYKNTIDDKYTSRLTVLLMLITANCIILSTFLGDKTSSNEIGFVFFLLCASFIVLLTTITLILCVYFYKSFFRTKRNYKVIPTADIRMFHFYIHKNNLLGTKDEMDLYNYLIDSYQYCAFINSYINSKREKAIILYDNFSSIAFILSIIIYMLLRYMNYDIGWIL